MTLENAPTIPAAPRHSLPVMNGKTKAIGGVTLTSVLAAVGYLIVSMLQQPVIDAHQDNRIDQVRNKVESNHALLLKDIGQLKDQGDDAKDERRKILDAVTALKVTQARRRTR